MPRLTSRQFTVSPNSLPHVRIVLADLAADEQATLLGAGRGNGTWSRYLVEKHLSKYTWYNPNRDNPDTPSLSKGWAYFEHFTLPRRFDQERAGHDVRAPPGELKKHTRLYRVFRTRLESLSGESSVSRVHVSTGGFRER